MKRRWAVLLLLGAILALLVASSPALAATATFDTRLDYSVGTNPRAVVLGDWNRDGDPDLALANGGSNNVSILANDGTGIYGSATNVSVGSDPRALARGDFDRDGDLDLAVANYGGPSVTILTNNGSGTFSSGSTLTADTGPQGIAVGDFNKDNRLDLAVTATGGNVIDVFVGNGDGTFVAKVTYAVAGGPEAIAVADIDRNGDQDLVATNGSAQVAVLMGGSGATFGSATTFTVGTDPNGVVVGDFNRDGKPDLATADCGSDTASVLLNTTTGLSPTFAARATYAAGSAPWGIATLDVDRDGRLDLAVTNNTATSVSVLPGVGDGSFAARTAVTVTTNPRAVASGDVDRNGKPDLVVADYGSAQASVLRSTTPFAQGIGFNAPSVKSLDVSAGPWSIVSGDFNGDGTADVAVAENGLQQVVVYRGDGSGGLSLDATLALPAAQPAMMVCADFDGNGTDDLAISDQFTSYVWVVLSTTSGTWGTPVACDLGSTNGQDVYGIDAGDIDRDGDVDLLVAASARDRVCVEINNGSGSFSNGNTYTVDLSPFGVALADFNRDGKLDLAAVSGGQNRVSIRLGNGDGTFGSLSYYATGTNPATAAVGDFNRDGKLDLAVADAGGQEVSVLTGVGDGTFNAKADYTVGLTPFSVIAADFNRDGILDLGTPDQGSDTVTVLRGLSNGTFTGAVSLSTGTAPQFVLAADLNRDGRDDIVSSDYLSDQISVFLTDGTAPVTTDNAPAGWRTVDTTVTLTASDDSSGVERIEYKVDSGSWQTDLTPPTAQVVISAPSNGSNDGVHTIAYRATDFVGNVETDKTCTVRVDTQNPSVTSVSSSTHPVQATWYSNSAPSLSWTGSDATSGVAGYSYILNQTSNTTPDTTSEGSGTSTSYTGVADGTWYFHVRAVDNAGFWGTAQHYTVHVDTTNPNQPTISSSTHSVEATWYSNSNPALSWTCSDPLPGSGLAGYSYILDQTSNTTPDTTSEGSGTSTSYTSVADGVWYFHARGVDAAGNWGAAQHRTVRIDTTAPSAISGLASSTHPVQANWYSNNTPAFTWSASTDPAPSSGVKGYSYVLDQTSNTTPDTTTETTGLSYTSGTVANGTWYFHIRTVDNAGNGGATTHYTVNVDVSAPSTTDDAPAGWRDTAVTVTLTPSDTASGVASTAYRVDGVGWQSGTSVSISAPSNGSNDATHTIEYYSTDNAGNVESTKNCQVKIDTQTPTTTDNAPPAWQSWSTTVTLTPGDAGSGVSLTEFRIDGGSWLTGTAATVRAWKRGGGVGIHTIEYYSTDNLGHVETIKSCQVKIDNVAPRTTDDAPLSGVPGPVTVTLTPSDAYSGVATTQYRLDFGGWQTGTSVAVSGVGTHRIEYYSTDNVGNDETRHRIVTVSIISARQVKFEVLHSPLVRDGRR